MSTTKPPALAKEDLPTEPGLNSLTVVGMGASAGGLAAIEEFFSGMPQEALPDMAFVIVQHLSPDHKSMLSELVQRYTRLRVHEVEDGMVVEPNCAYIIPPSKDMSLVDRTLRLQAQASERGLRLPIDFFFKSLAEAKRERAICVVLSGTGNDGTGGAKAIKGWGGLVMAQSPDSTEYDGMPRAVIATGLVDYVLPPREMPEKLIAFVGSLQGGSSGSMSLSESEAAETLEKLCSVLRAKTGHDFSEYKQNTMVRRVERRMALNRIELTESYLSYLRACPAEIEALFQDLLIGVTSFFRDKKAFEVVEAQVIPRLLDKKGDSDPVRIWICGCSTGEEAYSIAILLRECLEKLKRHVRVQIFATDIDSRAVEQARMGVFSGSIAGDVSAERLSRFFSFDQGSGMFRIVKSIRDLIVFSEQDVIKNPPFSRLDLICCRNLLIYMKPELQNRLFPLFHYALNPEGILFLGPSETVGNSATLFHPIVRKWRIYTRKEIEGNAPRASFRERLSRLPITENVNRVSAGTGRAPASRPSFRQVTEKALLAHSTQAALLVTAQGEILHIHGRTGKYLEPAPGEASANLLHMAREGLRRELTSALHRAVTSREEVWVSGPRVKTNGGYSLVDLSLIPLGKDVQSRGELYLVLLGSTGDPLPAPPESTGTNVAMDSTSLERIATLERELRVKDEYLQATIEEMETSNEELKSTNEELQSLNEELQSAVEELETSKEELQSVNEELSTVNAELQIKLADLSRANNDMNNLLAGTGIGTVFVDHQLRVSRFTPTATQAINLIPADVGRPLRHIVSNLVGYDHLMEDISQVLDTLVPFEAEVQTTEGTWYVMRVRPYRTLENVIEGAVITFVDTTERKQERLERQRAEGMAEMMSTVVRESKEIITIFNVEGRILFYSRGAELFYGWTAEEALRMNVKELIPVHRQEEHGAALRQLAGEKSAGIYLAERVNKDGRTSTFEVKMASFQNKSMELGYFSMTEREVLDRA